MRKYLLALLLLNSVVFAIASCGSRQHGFINKDKTVVDLQDAALVKKMLTAQYVQWRGVKHELGGLTKSGIDCSGFVYVTFLSLFGIELPRSTELQANVGVDVSRSELKAGDLVFFKTSLRQRHVGIYVDKNEFIHVSKSNGVTKSKLRNSYWHSCYWKAKRIPT